MVAMTLVPAGRDRGRGGIVSDLEQGGRAVEDRGVALDVKVKTGAPSTTRGHVPAARPESCPGAAGRKPANCGCRRGRTRAENGLTHTAALAFSATITIRSTASARSTPGPTTRTGRALSDSAAASAFIAAGSGPSSRLTAGLDRLRRTGPVVDRHRNEGGSAGRLHRHVVGAGDRRRHILGRAGSKLNFT